MEKMRKRFLNDSSAAYVTIERVITVQVKKAYGLQKVKGLIGDKHARGILIQTRFGIHTFGLRFPIDIIVLDRDDIVRVVKHSFKPNGIFLWPIRYDIVLELPQGMIKEKGITIGEKLALVLEEP